MDWIELEVEVAREALEPLSERLFELGTVGLEETDPEERPLRQVWDTGEEAAPSARVVLKAWFPAGAERAAIEAALSPFAQGKWRWREVVEEDWSESWKEGFEPFTAGPLVIAPPWNAPAGALVIEPGQGFGTGHHPTTRAVLEALVELAGGVSTVLDVGTGSGILALAAAKLGLVVRGIDNDPAAVADARRNAALNRLAVPFSTDPVSALAPADLVLANLHAEVLLELAPELLRVTGKRLVLGGILRDREAKVRAAFEPRLVLDVRRETDRWVSLRYLSAT